MFKYLTTTRYQLPLVLLLAIFLRLINLNQSFWLDEAAQILFSARPLSQQFDLLTDFHPPLYYLLVHFFTYVSYTEWWLRLSSVAIGVITVWSVYKLTDYLAGPRAALLAALFLAVSPYHVYYSQELRMYALSALLAVLSAHALLTQKWILYTISIVAGIYTLYIFPFIIIAHGLWILIAQRAFLFRWLVCLTCAAICFLPWLPTFLHQFGQGVNFAEIWPQWRNLSSLSFWKAIPLTYTKFVLGRIDFDNNLFYASLIVATLIFWLPSLAASFFATVHLPSQLHTYRSHLNQHLHRLARPVSLILCWLITPFLLALFISIWIPLNGPWRLLFLLPTLPVLAAIGITSLKNNRLQNLLSGGIFAISIIALCFYYCTPRFQREDWRGAITFITSEISSSPHAVVINAFPEPFAPVRWYAAPNLPVIGILSGLTATQVQVENNLEIAVQTYQDIYYFEYLQDLTDPHHYILTWIQNQGYAETAIYEFTGVGFIRKFQFQNANIASVRSVE